MQFRYRLLPGSPALQRWFFIGFALLCAIVLYEYVDLTPRVESNFFLSSDDPQLQDDKKIDRLFLKNSQVIISVATSDIRSDQYGTRIQAFSLELMELEDVASVKDIRHGPADMEDALKSPLWRRLLISDDLRSTHLIVTLDGRRYARVIPQIEQLAARHEKSDFRIAISGVPYVVEQIRRLAARDLKVFSLASLTVFAVLIAVVYRSLPILAGMLVTCLTASMLALILQDFLKLEPGVLIANVGTIVFVITLSHIVFMTANWRAAALEDDEPRDQVLEAVRRTGPASFWAMATTLLGFLSLLLAQAKPLRQFGLCTSVGALIAMVCAYLVYPSFLQAVPLPSRSGSPQTEHWMTSFLSRRHIGVTIVFGALVLAALPGLKKVNLDPSLFTNFKEGSELRQGLERIDRSGGSSPLDIVFRDRQKEKLNDREAYERMWATQEDLERDPAVGTVISLPVIMAEAERAPFSFLITWEGLLKRLEDPKYGRIARAFITPDRKYTRFVLRMKEEDRREPRQEIIGRLHARIRRHGFVPVLTGRLFILQGKMAGLLASSLASGLIGLLVFFCLICLIISRSLRVSTAILVFLMVTVVCLGGVAGHLGIPPDHISAPAASVAIAMGIDNSIHLMFMVRRRKRKRMDEWQAWVRARQELWRPITASCLVVATGFSIFLLSSFPPTQRFGFFVSLGTLLALVLVPLVVPVLCCFPFSEKKTQRGGRRRTESTETNEKRSAGPR